MRRFVMLFVLVSSLAFSACAKDKKAKNPTGDPTPTSAPSSEPVADPASQPK